ncbi:MAG TPA: hypothetical protein PLT82_04240 [Candidatus Hydrogenedens sp.]|nr:hypothetical protein [Candidatus Hydrogenedens sp.]HOL20946.1 hypothetical protein [Candidatus Hydrogenedens sp.]HPP58321.1 hypothetical protein [Candidatus Hydrogenedens sp.]
MPYPQFDRFKIHFKPLKERKDKVFIEKDAVYPDSDPKTPLNELSSKIINQTIDRLIKAKEENKSRMLVFGAHTIKNGLSPVIMWLLEHNWVTHIATNGAGIIHDWEFSYQGHSSEDVRTNVSRGEFGIWQETGFLLNLSIVVGACEGKGYGESVGAFVENEGLYIPSKEELKAIILNNIDRNPDICASASDLLSKINEFSIQSGFMKIPHQYKKYGLQACAYRLNIPFTAHPMIGHDIIYTHPMNTCSAIGRASQRDFLTFAHSVSNLENGVYLSIGSAVMSPMVFEKSLSMSQNVSIQKGKPITNHFIVVVDLQESKWDWSQGEPPMDRPEYYLRFNKSFSRMGGTFRYLTMDNRDFLLHLVHKLKEK